jgi:hypothetical protein
VYKNELSARWFRDKSLVLLFPAVRQPITRVPFTMVLTGGCRSLAPPSRLISFFEPRRAFWEYLTKATKQGSP